MLLLLASAVATAIVQYDVDVQEPGGLSILGKGFDEARTDGDGIICFACSWRTRVGLLDGSSVRLAFCWRQVRNVTSCPIVCLALHSHSLHGSV